MKRLRKAARGKRPELWSIVWILHHDNAPAHKAISVKRFVIPNSISKTKNVTTTIKVIPKQEFQKYFKQ
jgi:hypothetical protein